MHRAQHCFAAIAPTLLLSLLAPAAAVATTLYVDDETCPSAGDGSFANPFCTIESGILAAVDGDEVVVAPGTYTEAINWYGKAVTVRSSSGADVTTIDATGAFDSVATCASGEPAGTLLQGFTLTGGMANSGGGVRVDASSLTIRDCVIENNQAHTGGGVYGISGAVVTVEDSTIQGNTATLLGAGAYAAISGTQLTLRNVVVTADSTTPSVQVRDTCTLLVEGSTFLDVAGTALQADHATAIVRDTLFDGTVGYGLVVTDFANVTVSRSVFRRGSGVAVDVSLGTTTVVDNTIFVGNTSTGPIITNLRGDLTLVNCAMVANTFDNEDKRELGSVFLEGSFFGDSTSRIYNCVVWGNTPHDYIPRSKNQDVDVRYSLTDERVLGNGVFELDPRFVRMPDPGLNGWDGVDDDFGDLHLTSESPCIDAGNAALLPPGVATDMDGGPRNADAPCAAGNNVDVGPFEFVAGGFCGDGVCAGETCATCSCDCGSCCGNGVCDDNEDCANCKVDCTCPALEVPGNYPTIQAAIDAAGPGDIINVAPGTYLEAVAFNGRRVTLRSTGGPSVTTIDATGLWESAVRFSAAENYDSVLDGFTITGGQGISESSTSPSRLGGGIFSMGAVPTITNCVMHDNTADVGGGMCGDATALSDCTFFANTADRGAAIGNMSGDTVAITNCAFEDNVAVNDGGAISTGSLSATISNCDFARNACGVNGGAISASSLSGAVSDCTFVDNIAGVGGAIHLFPGAGSGSGGSIERCQFRGNVADGYGGGLYSRAHVSISYSLFEDNAGSYGGGAYVWSSDIRNSEFRHNAAIGGDGGGLYLRTLGGRVVTDSLIVENTAGAMGGGVALDGASVARCLIEGNTATVGGGAVFFGTGSSISASSIYANTAQSGGGVAFVNTRNAILVNSLVVGNGAALGGGVFAQEYESLVDPDDVHSSVVNCTVTANDGATGAGIAVDDVDTIGQPSPIKVAVFNAILRDTGGDEVWLAPTSELTIAYSDVNGGYTGVGNIDAAPIFVLAPNDGGDGFGDDPATLNVDESLNDDYGYLHLADGSPGIDAGSNPAVPPDVATDLGGKPRFLDDQTVPDTGEGPAPVVDMGAFERRVDVLLGDTVLASRYVTASTQAAGVETAIAVTCVEVNGFPDQASRTLWVGPPSLEPEEDTSEPARTFRAARLQCDPYFRDWTTVGVIYIHGGEILPESTYEITEYQAGPADTLGPAIGTPITARTGVYGDVAPLYAGIGIPAQPDFNDISGVVEKFLANPTAPIKAQAQLQPNVPLPMRSVDFRDISAAVSAFVGEAYADLNGITGPCTCPSAVTCGATSCTGDLDCGAGFCIDGFCTDACGRCTP